MPASQTRSVSYRIGEAASGGMGAISRPANQSESDPGHIRTASLGVACPLSPGADMVRETSHAILLCLGICPCRKPNREDRAFARPARYCHVAAQLAGDGETQAGSPEPLGGSWHRPDSFACRSVVMPMPVSAAAISMPHVRRTGFAP